MLTFTNRVFRGRAALPFITGVTLAAFAIAGTTMYVSARRAAAASRLVYSAKGFGGWVPVQPAAPPSTDPLKSVEAAYASGRYADAEAQAEQIVLRDEKAKDPVTRKNAVRAMWILAYSSARKGEFSPARDRFAMLREMASTLPDHGAYPPVLGQQIPTLEEEGAFQYAVCVGALGDKEGAEANYRDFMKEYPQSVLVHAALKRISKFHGGDAPADALKLWKSAMAAQKRVNDAADTESSLCGPECVAELIRRFGSNSPDVHTLAGEMHTTGRGTSLADLADTARKHGMHVTPLEMGPQFLHLQRLPAIAYVKPAHFVIVDKVSDQAVDLWDPDMKGPGHSGSRTEPTAQWNKDWSGILLEVRK